MSTMARDLTYALDPLAFARDPDPSPRDRWQAKFLEDGARAPGKRNVLILASRQVGKTETCIHRALHIAHNEPDETVVVISPRQDTSNEFIRRARSMYFNLPNPMRLLVDNTG
jgi:Terminase large subunit, T4likevirus-type, N-terminal